MALRDPRHGIGFAVLSGMALVGLVGAGPIDTAPKGRMLKQAYPPGELKDMTYSSPSGEFEFKRTRQGNDWILYYSFQGFSKRHEITCRVKATAAQRLIDEFSYQTIGTAIAKDIESQIKADKTIKDYFTFGSPSIKPHCDRNGKCRFDYEWMSAKLGIDQIDGPGTGRDKFDKWFHQNKSRLVKEAVDRFGFFQDSKQGWLINYAKVVERATPVLQNCIDEFSREVSKSPELLQKFFHAMPYTFIEDGGTGWITGGLRVPASVLLQDEGDCDSKAVAFCVLFKRPTNRLVIFRTYRAQGDKTPSHAFVGIENPFRSENLPDNWPFVEITETKQGDKMPATVRVWGRDFEPCDVTGHPEKLPYGMAPPSVNNKNERIDRDCYMATPIGSSRLSEGQPCPSMH